MTTALSPGRLAAPDATRLGRSASSPGRLAAPDATRLGRSVLAHCPGPAVGARDDDPHRIRRADRTLDDLLTAAWDGLAAHDSVTCPVCSGSMAPRYGSGAKPVGGRCTRCGSTLG
jgi:hypothetical protein